VLTWLIAGGTGLAVLAGVAKGVIVMAHLKKERERPKAPWEKEPPTL
jgi:hypothetical protein